MKYLLWLGLSNESKWSGFSLKNQFQWWGKFNFHFEGYVNKRNHHNHLKDRIREIINTQTQMCKMVIENFIESYGAVNCKQ